MFSATLKGMLAHKLRLFLTATSIALGVAFIAGTLMLTDSMQRAFDDVFGSINSGTDVAVRATEGPVQSDDGGEDRAPLPAKLVDRVSTPHRLGREGDPAQGSTDARGEPAVGPGDAR
jgi:putative ABC transport system permease protein